jgi:hypothetical protein
VHHLREALVLSQRAVVAKEGELEEMRARQHPMPAERQATIDFTTPEPSRLDDNPFVIEGDASVDVDDPEDMSQYHFA